MFCALATSMQQQGEEIALAIPSTLQQHLEDDCYWISRKEKVMATNADLKLR